MSLLLVHLSQSERGAQNKYKESPVYVVVIATAKVAEGTFEELFCVSTSQVRFSLLSVPFVLIQAYSTSLR